MKELVLSRKHTEIGAKMVDFAGYSMPVQYEGVNLEHKAVRESVGVFDVSHMGEIFIKGDKAEEFLQYITSNDVSKLSPGKVQYTCFPNENNGIVDDLLVYMIDINYYLLVVNASNIEKDIKWLNSNNSKYNCIIDNKSEYYSLLAIQGPKSIDLLQELTDYDLKKINYYNFKIINISGIKDVLVSRTGYTGEIGFELYIRNDYASKLWDSLFSTDIKLTPVGLAARDTLRLEKGYCLYGNDIDDSTSPNEAGLGWITKYNKEFVNSANLKREKEFGVSRKLIGLEIISKGIARKGYNIIDDENNIIGSITSGTMSPTLKKAIALAYLDIEFTKEGTIVFVEVRKKRIKAQVVKASFV
tara:strand:- start:1876 stop:2949 length:1074 start_codon:yes stop_codon:yes gene_type:complete